MTRPNISKLAYNSIPEQKLTYANQLNVRDWNIIINSLRMQTNSVVDYLKLLHMWLDGLDANLNIISSGNLIRNINYDPDEQLFSINYLNGITDTIHVGTGNANIYYDDTLPTNPAKIKNGDLYFDEQ